MAEKNHIRSIALCCISTGEFYFPNDKAAENPKATYAKGRPAHQRKSETAPFVSMMI